MADKPGTPAAGNAAGASSSTASSSNAGSGASSGSAAKKPLPEQNPAFRMMGLPRFRLPSRNWMIFLSITGGITGAIVYDKWQTKRTREKWCHLVSHLANEPLDTKTAPRKVTIYLSAPPGDGLRGAREHFHTYVKPILVSAAMDWDVVEGRKEGDVRHKTAEKIRKRRKRNGEGASLSAEEEEAQTVESIREKNGDVDYPGVAGDIVIGRNTWKEYIRGLHEGYLGPPDPPKGLEAEEPPDPAQAKHDPGHSTVGDAAVTAAANVVSHDSTPASTEVSADDASPTSPELQGAESASSEKPADEKKEEKPKRRFPPSYILPDQYQTATASPSTPDIIGPSVGVRLPHLLGFRNTPTRIYRFLNRRTLQDDIGFQVAAAILGTHRPYTTLNVANNDGSSSEHTDVPEQREVLAFEERDWWKKTVHRERQEHEESVWIEPMIFDERIASRMRTFELTGEDQDRAKRIGAGIEKPVSPTTSED